MAFLYKTVPMFKDTWIKCLSDLSQYYIAIKDVDLHNCENWVGVAYFWYSKAVDKSPFKGHLHYYLAILAWPNAL
jgi:hypothetical protein